MTQLYPFRFKPTFRRYLWGGRRLETVLGKPLGEGDDYAESWEVVDHGQDQSVVAFGPMAETPLGKIVHDYPYDLFGLHGIFDRFPLLFKFLDANRNLSVQVHPNDEQGSRMMPPDLGKTEAWVILDAEPESQVYAGLKDGIDRESLAQHLAEGTAVSCLHHYHPNVGDCIFIPAGIVHALGAGLLVAEIQQSSDTTFRLYDWDRVGADGKPRQLHIDDALGTIDYRYGPAIPQSPHPMQRPGVNRLVASEKFVLDRWESEGSVEIGGDDRFHIVAVLEGSARFDDDPSGLPLERGQTILLPACQGASSAELSSGTVLMDMYLPIRSDLQ